MESYALMLQTDPDDKLITESAMASIPHPPLIRFASDMHEIKPLISRVGLPSVILLNDSGASNSENQVLRSIKSTEDYAHIPVVVLGEVASPEYIRACYKAGANTYIVKPATVLQTREKIEIFFAYWFSVAEI